MKELIKSIKDFKIIPNNFESASTFTLINVDDNKIEAKLSLTDNDNLNDYTPDDTVEVFGVNNNGLVYFETKIIARDNDTLQFALPVDYSIIQRREYSRVAMKQGEIKFKDINENIVQEIRDISAGGVKIIANTPLDLDREYDIEILLSNNMTIQCKLQPIRINKIDDSKYNISARFLNLENIDRIILIQYTFKIKMEEDNKENNQ